MAGRKVSPENIERALGTHPGVKECVVFGVSDPGMDRGETIVACLAIHGQTTVEDLKQHLLRVLPAWQVPRDWFFVPNLTTNSRGKLARAQWREYYLEHRDSQGPAVN